MTNYSFKIYVKQNAVLTVTEGEDNRLAFALLATSSFGRDKL